MRVCSTPNCATLIPKPGKCKAHRKESEEARGSREERGYTLAHILMRKRLAPIVAEGTTLCARCRQPIRAGQAWHLDHDDDDRTRYIGPSHARCNLSAGGIASHRT